MSIENSMVNNERKEANASLKDRTENNNMQNKPNQNNKPSKCCDFCFDEGVSQLSYGGCSNSKCQCHPLLSQCCGAEKVCFASYAGDECLKCGKPFISQEEGEKCICNHSNPTTNCYPVMRCACPIHYGTGKKVSPHPTEKECEHNPKNLNCYAYGHGDKVFDCCPCTCGKSCRNPLTHSDKCECNNTGKIKYRRNGVIGASESSPISWEEEFEEVFKTWINDIPLEDIKSFITEKYKEAYEKGFIKSSEQLIPKIEAARKEGFYARSELTQHAKEMGRQAERQRIREVVEGMRKEETPFSKYHVIAINRTIDDIINFLTKTSDE